MTGMTRLLEKAVARVSELPAGDQDALASALLAVAGLETQPIELDEDTRAAIEEAIGQAERGEFVSDDIVAEANKRHGI